MSSPRFNFRLQRLLELRRLREQESARLVADAQRAADDARAAVARLDDVRAAGAAQLAAVHGRARSVGELQRAHLLLGHLDQHIAQADTLLQSAEEQVAESVAEYTTAARMRQMLDRLREKQQDLWRVATAQTEQKEIDEIAVMRYQGNPSLNGSGVPELAKEGA